VGYNIKYGSAGASDEEVAEVVQQSNLGDTLSKFPLVSKTAVSSLLLLCLCAVVSLRCLVNFAAR